MSFSLRQHLACLSLLIIFLGLGFIFSLTWPFTAGLDEVAHFQFTRFIAGHGRLPISGPERAEAGYKSDLPPLFHLLVGLAGRGIDLDSPPFVKLTQDNPRLLLVVVLENILGWRAITTEDPLQGEVLLWYLGRWLAIVGGAVGIGATYLLIRAFSPADSWLALSGTAVLAFLSTYSHVSSVISYESLLGAWLACYFLVLFGTLAQPAQNWRYLALGLLLGLAILTKYTPLPALPILPLLIIWLAYQNHWPWQTTGWRLALFGLGVALPVGSWLLFTEIYFNQVARLGWVSGLLNPFLASDGSDETSLRLAGFISGGQVGLTDSIPTGGAFLAWAWRMVSGIGDGGWLTWLLLGLWAVAVIGLIRYWFHPGRFDLADRPRRLSVGLEAVPTDFPIRLWLILMVVHLSLFLFLPLARFLITGQVVTGMGQHILFPAATILTSMLVQGLRVWLVSPRLTVLLWVVAGLCLWQSISVVVKNYTPPWPIQTVPLTENEPLVATFGQVSLISYHHQADQQILQTTLQWRSEALASEDYRLELTLIDGKGQPQARWRGQLLNGRYPTRAWLPGDRVRDEIILPIAGLPPGDYQVQLRWLGEASPIPPQLRPATEKSGGSALPQLLQGVNLGQITLAPSPLAAVKRVQLKGQSFGYSLWPQPVGGEDLSLYQENATIIISIAERLPDEIHLSLIGPDEQPHAPIDHLGSLYSFVSEPHFASGDYKLRFEQWTGGELVAQVATAPLLRIQTQARQFQSGQISHPLQVNFADQVALIGYDLPERRVQAGDNFPVTLYWQALKVVGADLIMFNHLIDSQQKIWGGRDRRAHEVYSTMLWASGEIVSDAFNVQVAPNAPDGIYNLLVGLYLPVGQASVSLPLLQDGQLSDVTHVNLGLIKVGHGPPGLAAIQANPQHPINQVFGESPQLTLLGYDLTDPSGQSVQTLKTRSPNLNLTLYWRCEAPLPLDYTAFVHVRNAAGETVVQKDQPPLNGVYPTSLWDPGEIIADTINVPLPALPPAGIYQIVIGLYDFQTGQRLAVPGSSANEVSLTDVSIP